MSTSSRTKRYFFFDGYLHRAILLITGRSAIGSGLMSPFRQRNKCDSNLQDVITLKVYMILRNVP